MLLEKFSQLSSHWLRWKMNGIRTQGQQTSAAHLIEKLDTWLTCHNLTESFLIITNFLLLLKSSSNLVAVFNESRELIADYNGATLFSDGFRCCFVVMNLAILAGSLLCLMALLFVSAPKTKLKLLKYFVISQLALAFAAILLMGRLWFAPFKLELDPDAWSWTIRRYNYQFRPDVSGLWPNGLPRNRAHDLGADSSGDESLAWDRATSLGDFVSGHYHYRDKVDKLQQALGCCGIWSPAEWRRNENLGLLAPSCCLHPARVDGEFPMFISARDREPHLNESSQADSLLVYRMKQIFFCQWAEYEDLTGCQVQLNDRETRFLFRLRLNLLLLVGLLFLNVMSQALLKFDLPLLDHNPGLISPPLANLVATIRASPAPLTISGQTFVGLPPPSYSEIVPHSVRQVSRKSAGPPNYGPPDLNPKEATSAKQTTSFTNQILPPLATPPHSTLTVSASPEARERQQRSGEPLVEQNDLRQSAGYSGGGQETNREPVNEPVELNQLDCTTVLVMR